MSSLVIPYPGIDPVAFSLGPIDIRWYGLAFAAGIILGWLYIRSLVSNQQLWENGRAPLNAQRADDLVFWIMIGAVLGGRLGHVFLYEPQHYLANPLEIIQVWKGGMSFHGALAGTIATLFLFAAKTGIPVRHVMDLSAAAIPLGLFLGRIANFINSEHWGHTSHVPWAMVFPNGGPEPRHPSQLYEAALEGALLFLVLRVVTHRLGGLKRPGLTAGTWLIGYAIARIVCEVFRVPEEGHALNLGPFTAGQLYSLPMIAFGIYLIATANNRHASQDKAATR